MYSITPQWLADNRAPDPLVAFSKATWGREYSVGLEDYVSMLIRESTRIKNKYGGENRRYIYNGYELAGWVVRRIDRDVALTELRRRKLHRILDMNSNADNARYLTRVVKLITDRETTG